MKLRLVVLGVVITTALTSRASSFALEHVDGNNRASLDVAEPWNYATTAHDNTNNTDTISTTCNFSACCINCTAADCALPCVCGVSYNITYHVVYHVDGSGGGSTGTGGAHTVSGTSCGAVGCVTVAQTFPDAGMPTQGYPQSLVIESYDVHCICCCPDPAHPGTFVVQSTVGSTVESSTPKVLPFVKDKNDNGDGKVGRHKV